MADSDDYESSDEDIDTRMQHTIREIEEIDTCLRQLNDRKAERLAHYDDLKEQKMLAKSLALSSKNWNKG